MRVFGRVTDQLTGARSWAVVETQPNGNNDYVHLTALIQCLKLNTGESPFWGNYGIPAKNSVLQQIAPDYSVARIQAYFSRFFASLIITKTEGVNPATPIYNIDIIRNDGSTFQKDVPT